MEGRPPTIASSNRFKDLEPYCSHTYHQKPVVWGSIFPWEFPQGAEKEQEEEFLSSWFSQDEIYMQGYRFLKQVFYCIALYNLDVRIPAFTDWWLSKPSSVEILNDTKLQPFLVREDATPSTFFEDELPEYGEKFLRWVIPYLQKTIKQRLEDSDRRQKAAPAPIDLIRSSKVSSREVIGESEPKTAQSVASVVKTTVSLPSPAHLLPMSAKEIPLSAPPLTTSMEEASRTRVVSNEQEFQAQPPRSEPPQEAQIQRGKRGNSFGKPFNQRGRGNFPSRNERNGQMYPTPIYATSPDAMRNHPRVISAGPANFMNPIPQGHAVPPMPPMQRHFTPMQLCHHPHQGQDLPQDPTFAVHRPPPYFNHPFEDPQHVYGFAPFEPRMQYFHDPESFHRDHRRNSQGSRGKSFRGHNRGENSRGRNSFSSHEYFQPAMQNDNRNAKQHPDFVSQPFTSRQRRGSGHAIFEKKWRSGSENPQVWSDQTTKENRPPQQLWAEHTAFAEPVPSSNPSKYHQPYHHAVLNIDPSGLGTDQKCNQHWIGPDCTFVDKLIALDVPSVVDDSVFLNFFNTFGRVQQLGRNSLPHVHQDPDDPKCLLFITFVTAAEARHCLLNKPDRWLDGRLLKLEVPRQYWEPTHPKYIFQRRGPYHDDAKAKEERRVNSGQISSILRRSDEDALATRAPSIAGPETEAVEDTSAEMTPTPSGASTPKKKNSKSRNKKASRKDKEDLRKASLKIDTDNMVDKDESSANEQTNGDHATHALEKQRSDTEQTEVRTMSEPTLFSPTDSIQTNLPLPNSAETDIQTASEVASSPAEDVTTRLPDEAAHIPRAEEKAETAETKDISEEMATPHISDSDPVDESFHTASGSTEHLAEPEKAEIETTIQPATSADAVEESTQDRISSPDSAALPKTVRKVPVPQLPPRMRLPSNSSCSTLRPEGLEPPPPSASAISPALPTPIYFTAPNTPAVPQMSPTEEEHMVEEQPKAVEQEAKPDPPPASKKLEKAKGPAETESFSMFGKKKETKKPKGGNKGTLKGKPKMDSNALSEVASDSMSRVVSGASTPIIQPVTDSKPIVDDKSDNGILDNSKADDHMLDDNKTNDNASADNKPADVQANSKDKKRKHRSDSKATQQPVQISQDTERAIAEDLIAPPNPQQETPSKRKGFGSMFSGLNIFTGTKNQERPAEKDSKQGDDPASKADGLFGQTKFSAFKSLASSGDMNAKGSNPDTSNKDAEAAEKKSKKKKMGRKKKKKAAEGVDESSQPGQPAPEPKSSPTTFPFGKDDATPFQFDLESTGKEDEKENAHDMPTTPRLGRPATVVDEQDDETEIEVGVGDISDTLSKTDPRQRDAASPDTIQSPTTPSGKKLPPKRTDTSHLIAARTPTWKQRKRIPTPRKVDTPTGSEAGDETSEIGTGPVLYVQCRDPKDSPTLEEYLEGEQKPRQKYYLYVGRGSREEDLEGAGEEEGVSMDSEKLRSLAKEEQRKLKEKGEKENVRVDEVGEEV